MSLAPGLTKLYLIASPAPCCESPASVVCAHCECRPGGKIFAQIQRFIIFAFYHFIVVIEAEEALQILPICLNYVM